MYHEREVYTLEQDLKKAIKRVETVEIDRQYWIEKLNKIVVKYEYASFLNRLKYLLKGKL